MRRFFLAGLVGLFAVSSACDPTGPTYPTDGELRAVIDGDVSADYLGNAKFTYRGDATTLTVSSSSDRSGAVDRIFLRNLGFLFRADGSRVSIQDLGPGKTTVFGFTAVVWSTDGLAYGARTGYLEVREITDERLRLSFGFTAHYYCGADPDREPCDLATVPEGAPFIEVRGELIAVAQGEGLGWDQ